MPATLYAPPTTPIRSVSLKYHRKNSNLKKKHRPNTWTTTCHFNNKYRRYTISPRVSRWVSQHNQKRQTVATISTLTTNTNSDTTTLNYTTNDPIQTTSINDSIFHTQSLLFLFGFLYFPCWWIGGYYLKVDTSLDVEKRITVHPSLLANGKTASRILWLPYPLEYNDTHVLFYKWNRCMSLVSIGITLVDIGLIIWYFIAYH